MEHIRDVNVPPTEPVVQEMGVNREGSEVALYMREQMIAMQRQIGELLRLLGREFKR